MNVKGHPRLQGQTGFLPQAFARVLSVYRGCLSSPTLYTCDDTGARPVMRN
jgi:hypothetical protein